MNKQFTGREKEVALLNEALLSGQPEMIAIVGRRRVGKTHLIRQVFEAHLDFSITGMQDTPDKLQLENFANKLTEYAKPPFPVKGLKNWLEAFQLLKDYLSAKSVSVRKVIFFDELPWIVQRKSGFLEALGHFWNDWAAYNNVVLIVCGSAASWMTKQVVHHKGSLHNRITRLIHLQPFTLEETEKFLRTNNVQLSRYDILQLYMVMGGVPHYLKEIRKGESVARIIDRTCFEKNGLLHDEFDKLYYSLYDRPEKHIAIIKALAGKWNGMTRTQLVQATGLADGGTFTRTLTELEQSDFITAISPFEKKKKDLLYRLTDNYSLFYLKFMEKRKKSGGGNFTNLAQTAVWKSWCGYAFENVCFIHLPEIKKALGIAGVYTEVSSFLARGSDNQQGAQVDMLISRADNIIHICEIKFYDAPFTITKKYAETLRTKRALVKEKPSPKKSLFITLITCFGIQQNAYSLELVQNEITATRAFFQ